MMTNQLFAAALGIQSPWFVQDVNFDESKRQLTIQVDFKPGSRFAHADAVGEHPVRDTQIKRLRHLNFFQHECFLEVFTPARSQSAPLDVQYVQGEFAPPPSLKRSLDDMFKGVIADGEVDPEHGLIGIGALYALMPADQLPAGFVNFVKEHGLERVTVSPIRQPAWYADRNMRLVVMEKFKALPIFGA